jgi:hypothetical protein
MIRICKDCKRRDFINEDPSRTVGNEYCNKCKQRKANRDRRSKFKKEGKCYTCGKPVDTKNCPHCDEILKTYTKCKKCRCL